MNHKRVGVIAECVCDLPKNIFRNYDIDVLYFLIETESGVFTDTDEITAENVISLMEAGAAKTRSFPPSIEVYQKAFEKNLSKYDEVILVTISSAISASYDNALQAAELFGEDKKRIYIMDSGHLSSGLGFLVMHAAVLANRGCMAKEIISELNDLKSRVSTTFITRNANYLYRNGLVSKSVKNICAAFDIHPVLTMKKGKMVLKTVVIGNYDSAAKYYVKRELKGKKNIDTKCAFVTCVGCSVKMLDMIISEVEKCCSFDDLKITSASATISSNCGPGTFGVLFIRNK